MGKTQPATSKLKECVEEYKCLQSCVKYIFGEMVLFLRASSRPFDSAWDTSGITRLYMLHSACNWKRG